MNQKKATELRRKAHTTWINLPEDYKKQFTVHQVYKQLKKDLKNGKDITR